MRKLLCVFLLSAIAAFGQAAQDWPELAKVFGKQPMVQGGIAKVTFPRTDLHVKVGDTEVRAAAGLTGWAAFRREGKDVVADGDLVLQPSEVGSAITALQAGGLEITGLHNHIMGEQPEVMYLHFFAKGDEETILKALAVAVPPIPAAPKSDAKFPADAQKTIEAAMGKPGNANGDVLAFAFPRAHEIAMHGITLPPAMGMATGINYQPSPKGVAATGDFVLHEAEVNPVVKALRAAGIEVTAIHNHLLDDNPRMVFVHFWAEGPADKVAAGLKAALHASEKGRGD